jgi:hypothetical protein
VGPVAFGEQAPPKINDTVNAYDTQPTPDKPSTPTSRNTQPLTIAQQQWLKQTLKKDKSAKKQFKKMLAHINHPEASIRAAAYQMAQQLLERHPKLSDKKAINFLKKVLRKVSTYEEVKEVLQLLDALVKENPSLTLTVSKTVIDLTKNRTIKLAHSDMGREIIMPLTQTLIAQSSACAGYLLTNLHKQARDPHKHDVIQASGITTATLIVATQLLHTEEIVAQNPKYVDMVLDIALDGASLQALVFDTPAAKDKMMRSEAQTLLRAMMQKYPSVTNKKYNALTTLVTSEDSNMLAIAHLLPFAAVDQQYLKEPFSLLTSILEFTDARVQNQAELIYYRDHNNSTTISGGLTGLLAGTIVDAATQKTTRRLCMERAKNNDDNTIGIPALRLIREMILLDPAMLPAALTIFQKHLGNEEESASLQEEVLNVLTCMVTENDTDTLKVIDMATPHAQNRSADVRKATLNLLETILSTEEQSAQNTKVLDSLHLLSQDKHVKIRKHAQALYKKYIPATPIALGCYRDTTQDG